jgi:hypothetical protein
VSGVMALRGFFRGRAWSVKDRDDDDQREGVGRSELRALCGLGDAAECVRGGNGNGSFRGLFGIKLELDFHRRGRLDRKRENNLGIKKSSIDGN